MYFNFMHNTVQYSIARTVRGFSGYNGLSSKDKDIYIIFNASIHLGVLLFHHCILRQTLVR